MKNSDSQISQAAMAQFAKYGIRKTTMQDVADEAGVSRQTLYNRVPNKDALLQLVARCYFEDIMMRCVDDVSEAVDLSAALDVLIGYFVKEPWQTIHAMPEAGDFEAATDKAIAGEVEKASAKKMTIVSETITHFYDGYDERKAQDIARFFCATASGVKSEAKSAAELETLCDVMKASLLATLHALREAA